MGKLDPNGNEKDNVVLANSVSAEKAECIEEEKSGITLGQIGRMIAKHWVAGVICLLVGLAGGVVYGEFIQTPKYQSSVDLMVVNDDSDSKAANISVARAQTQIFFKYLTTDEVLSRVGVELSSLEGKNYDYYLRDSSGNKTDKIDTSAVSKLYTVTLPTITTSTTSVFITVTSTAKNSTLAIDVANTVANAAIELVKDPTSIGYGYLKNSLALMGEANAAKKTSTSTVVWAAVGALAGAVIGCAYGTIRESANNKVSSKADLETVTGYKVIGMIPKYANRTSAKNTSEKEKRKDCDKPLPKSSSSSSRHRINDAGLIEDMNSPEADAIIRLQTNIEFASLDKKINCYAVTSAQEAEGKTTMSSNLALIYAAKGLKVALLDLDLRRPSVHRLFGFKNQVGVVDYCKGDAELNEIVHSANGVDVISAGSNTPFPSKTLGSSKMKELISDLRKKYDYVILDTPPVLVVSDAYAIGHDVDGFLVVCSQHVSKKKDVNAACKSLEEKKMNVIGLATAMVTTDEDYGKYGYGYATKYDYGYGYRVDRQSKASEPEKEKNPSK